ncbi:hypothetical protein [Microbacterium sp. NPDC057650]|uniref:hypothetical protein n=1 Tax=unclassified Microbacterium TaxID=2609290 RepID=UPI00366BFC40
MIDEDAAGRRDARVRRRTWVTGGILLVLAALVGFVARFELGRFAQVKDLLWAVGVVVLVIGLGRAGSITGRKMLASVVVLLQVLVASPLAWAYVSSLVLKDPASPQAEEDSWKSIFPLYYLVLSSLTVFAALLIGIARSLPSPWNWAPAWVLGAAFISLLVGAMMFPGMAGAVRVAWEIPGVGTAFLGVLGIVLGLRAASVRTASPAPASDQESITS